MKLEKKLTNMVALGFLIITVAAITIFLEVPDFHGWAKRMQLAYSTSIAEGDSVLSLMKEETKLYDQKQDTMQGQLRIVIPDGVSQEDITIKNDYLNDTVYIKIPDISGNYFVDTPMIGRTDHIEDIVYETNKSDGVIAICLDGVYLLDEIWDETYLYLDFTDPHEVYDKIVVVDAGHGGTDPGANIDGVMEKDIDLAIVEKIVDNLAEDTSVGVFVTRADDSAVSLQDRVGLANRLQADLFLSIHNNSTSSGRISTICGTEVMYLLEDEDGSSKAFAQTCLDYLLFALGSESKGVVAGDDIYIIRNATMPVALAEIGFMTNTDELALLQTDEYQKKAADALSQAILATLGMDSSN